MSAVGEVVFTAPLLEVHSAAGTAPMRPTALLGVEGMRYTKTVQKHCCRLAAEMSFATTSENMHEMLGVDLCPETVRTMVEGHGQKMARFQAEDTASATAFQAAEGRGRIHDRRGQGEYPRRGLERPENRGDFQA